mmetsp:Transcript_228/g.346  ORF Transcript_228/g.346 Transcript_228/m.346 type:complete len:97 (+) Transcript_228:1-291(+)
MVRSSPGLVLSQGWRSSAQRARKQGDDDIRTCVPIEGHGAAETGSELAGGGIEEDLDAAKFEGVLDGRAPRRRGDGDGDDDGDGLRGCIVENPNAL